MVDEKNTTNDADLSGQSMMNVPNMLTSSRIVISFIFFFFLALGWYMTALVLFVLAATTDWVDGYWARKYGQVTQLGRILDPFADKLLICGAFVFLAAAPQDVTTGHPKSEIFAWMAVLVVARELLVTGLRSFFEQAGVDFSASWSGKWKMVFQCLAVGFSLYLLSYVGEPHHDSSDAPAWVYWSLVSTLWIAILLTLYSGWGYVRAGLGLLKK